MFGVSLVRAEPAGFEFKFHILPGEGFSVFLKNASIRESTPDEFHFDKIVWKLLHTMSK